MRNLIDKEEDFYINLDNILTETSQLVKEKNKAYNSSFIKVTDILEILFPDGINKENYFEVSLMIRILDKICRMTSTKEDRLAQQDENSWKDIIGYVLLILATNR